MGFVNTVSETTAAVWATLMRDYYLTIALLALVLIFAVYVHLSPTATEFFTGGTTATAASPSSAKKQNTR